MIPFSLDLGSHPRLHSLHRILSRLPLHLPKWTVPRIAPQNLKMLLERDRPC